MMEDDRRELCVINHIYVDIYVIVMKRHAQINISVMYTWKRKVVVCRWNTSPWQKIGEP